MVRLGFIPLGILSCIATRGGLARVHAHIPSHTCKYARGNVALAHCCSGVSFTPTPEKRFLSRPRNNNSNNNAHMPNFVAPTTCPMLHRVSSRNVCGRRVINPLHHYYGTATAFMA